MSHDPTVNAGDIARLAGVGRAAVSNWRRRHDDFPQPAGGTAAQPVFSLREVETWLHRYGKSYQVSPGDRVWQRLRAAGDLRLGELVAEAGDLLTGGDRPTEGHRPADNDPPTDSHPPAIGGRPGKSSPPTSSHPPTESHSPTENDSPTGSRPPTNDRRPAESGPPTGSPPATHRIADPELAELVASQGALGAFEFLCERYLEAHSRQLATTRDDVAELMVALACPGDGTVFDPASGIGTLLLAPKATRLIGQELSDTSARITSARLRLRGADAQIATGDSLRHDAFPGLRADAVVCDPPFNERAWGYEELSGDPRWEFGLPPRGEPELAWVQHCLTHVKPGGLVAILMPAAAASRRAGRRIRANLLRAGALRAVVTLWAGGPDLWLLRRPGSGERPPSEILIMEAADDLADVAPAWQAYLDDRAEHTVRIIDLLDDDVDLSPARHVQRGGADLGRAFTAARERFLAATVAPPDLRVLAEPIDQPATTIGELVKAGLVTILQAPPRMSADGGDLPVLLADDVAAGSPPSGWTSAEPGLVTVEPGDVVATYATARVLAEGGAVLGPQLTLYRVDRRRLDPDFLAGFLRSAGGRVTPGSSRVDARRTRLPRLSLPEQRVYGNAFRQLVALEDAVRETSELGETLVRLGLDGLADGRLHPRD